MPMSIEQELLSIFSVFVLWALIIPDMRRFLKEG